MRPCAPAVIEAGKVSTQIKQLKMAWEVRCFMFAPLMQLRIEKVFSCPDWSNGRAMLLRKHNAAHYFFLK
jgi:hypothetical protein